MSIVKTPTNIDTLKINYLTQEMYDAALENDEINENELYLTPSDGSGGNTNSVELTQAEYDALTTEEKNNGTIYFITDGTASNLIVNDSVPIGAIQAYGGATAPAGWLMCDGSAVSRSAYAELYAAIGTVFGEGDGSTTFNLPDLRGRTAIGSGVGTASDATARTIGQTGGSEGVTLTTAQIPSHNHPVEYAAAAAKTAGDSTANYMVGGYSGNTTITNWAFKIGNAGGGESHENMQPYIATNYIIKAKDHSLLQANLLPMLDFFYPVGSYYETSDTNYNPNVSMGGEWVLETEGQVHVSGGSNYTISGALDNTSDGGSEDAIVPYHNHSVNAVTTDGMSAHSTHSHTIYGKYKKTVAKGSNQNRVDSDGTSSTSAPYSASSADLSHTHSVPAHNTNYVGTSGEEIGANMQPYIVVNRWHRVA